KILGMPVDPSAMSPIGGGMALNDEPSQSSPPVASMSALPEAVLTTGRVAELGLAGLGAPRAVDDDAEATEVVQVPKNFSLKWIGIYALIIAAGAAGVSWYAYTHAQEGAHHASPIVAVPEPNRPPA